MTTSSPEGTRRLLSWNIRYGAGTGISFHLPFPVAGYLRPTRSNTQRIERFIAYHRPDMLALTETDLGSLRAGVCQASALARAAGHAHVFSACKYTPTSSLRRLPVFAQQGNALSARHTFRSQCHYLSVGSKRLVLEAQMTGLTLFVVHLSTSLRQRRIQLDELGEIVRRSKAPAIVTGDFNTFAGTGELRHFLDTTGLRCAREDALLTYPSLAPRRQLDHVLVDPAIEVLALHAPTVQLSDHLPIIADLRFAP